MPFILLYLIKLSVSLAIVFLFYYFILRKLTFYNHNRWYLLGYTLLSFFIPFINISPVLENNNWDNSGVVNWLPVIAKGDGAAIQHESLFSAWYAVVAVFITGMIVMFIRLLLQLLSFRKLIKSATVISNDGMSLYQVDENIIPFSFGNSIFINRHLHKEDELQEIISHEFVHVKQRHSLDIIWGELLCLLNWYNPFAWLLRRSMRQNLEFIADNKVLENGVDRKQYQYLLLKVIGNNQFSIASKFNFSSLKKRIAMMNKLKSAKVHLFKFLFVLPIAVVMLLAFRNKYEKTQQQAPAIPGTAALDTIPKTKKVAQLPKEIEEISVISTKDDQDPVSQKTHGMVVVKRKDGGKEIYDMGNAESRAAFEKKYGVKLEDIVPPPPPPPPTPPVPADMSTPPTPPAPPEPVKLPENVKRININNNKATVDLKNGQQENYDLNDAEQKKKFEIKYGEFVPPPPPPPANDLREIPVDRSLAPEKRVTGVRLTEMPVEGPLAATGTPLYVLDGEITTVAEVNKLPPHTIASVDVLKGSSATTAYGDKAKDGAVIISTKANVDVKAKINTDAVVKTNADIRTNINTNAEIKAIPTYTAANINVNRNDLIVSSPSIDLHNSKQLLLLDGKEIPATVKKLEGAYKVVSLTKEEAVKKYGEKGKNGVVEITTVK